MLISAFVFNVLQNFFCFFFFETGSHYIVQVRLELTIFLLQPLECWNYRHVPSYLTKYYFEVLEENLVSCRKIVRTGSIF
jgi:hypothetical protein